MPTPSEPPPGTEQVEDRRLHPLSWLFVLLQQLRSFAIPLVVLLITGRGNNAEWFGLVGVVGLTAVSIAQYFTYRYRAGAGGFIIRSGLLQRTNRDIPYERIHTVNLHQTLLHRLFGVTEVRLESAGSKEAEAVMRVLSVADARALELLIRERSLARRADTQAADGSATATPDEVPLLSLDAREVVRLGLISNRGMVVVAAAFGAMWQVLGGRFSSDNVPDALVTFASGSRRFVADHLHDVAALVVLGILLLVVLLAFVRLLSVLLALLQYYGFSLVEVGRQLRVERGLLTRVRNQLPRRRIQAWRIDESLLHRWCKRQSVRVDSAAGNDGDDHGVRHLIPIATPATVTSLLHHLIADDVWPPAAWHALHPNAWRRAAVVPCVIALVATAATWWFAGVVAVLPLGLVPLIVWRSRRVARFSGYALTTDSIVVRWGWLSRHWGIIDIRKLQSLRLTQSPLDRRHGMATIWFDSAGAGATDGVLRVHHLAADDARSLHNRVARAMDARL